MPPAGRYISEHYAPEMKKLSEQEKPFWESDDPSHMRVLIEQRPNEGMRQLLGLDELIEACDSQSAGGFLAPQDDSDAKGAPGYRTVECRQFQFGSRGFLYDMWVMRQADVLVSLHGAGQINSMFMPEHSSVIEVRAVAYP